MSLPIALLAATIAAAPAAAFERVTILDREIDLQAYLLRPPGPGPFPAVVALHGCSGIGRRRSAPVSVIYQDWGERLAAAGYVVIFPDSFGSRGAGPQCTVRERRIRPGVERARDANAARRWLQAQPFVKADRVHLLGWSHGGLTTLWAAGLRASRDGNPDFHSAIAFYPGCRAPEERGWKARVPTLILIGAADDWTPPEACEALARSAREGSAPVEHVTYPNAYHAFDHPNLPIRQRSGLAYTADGSGRAHIGTDQPARADAIRRVMEWLAR